MSSKKRRRAFNHEWRKARKILKRARLDPGERSDNPEVWRLAEKYKIDFPSEKIK